MKLENFCTSSPTVSSAAERSGFAGLAAAARVFFVAVRDVEGGVEAGLATAGLAPRFFGVGFGVTSSSSSSSSRRVLDFL